MSINNFSSGLKKRYIGLDLFRIISAIFVFMYHSTVQMHCNYGILHNASTMGAVFMTAFFMLSGFSLFLNYSDTDLSDFENTKRFWKKRALSILPMYFFVAILFETRLVFLGIETIDRAVLLLPIETLGVQSAFSSLFPYSHNGATWFISCILICYFLYPLLQKTVLNISVKTRIILMCISAFLIMYAPIVTNSLDNVGGIYANPFFRSLEFFIGVILASMKKDRSSDNVGSKSVSGWISVLMTFIVMFAAITILVDMNFEVGNFMMYNWVCLPCFTLILYGFSDVSSKWLERSRLMIFLSKQTYHFYLAQLFADKVTNSILNHISVNNTLRILIAWAVCISITIVFNPVERGIKFVIKTLSEHNLRSYQGLKKHNSGQLRRREGYGRRYERNY